MKRRTMLRLIVSLLLIAAFVVGATILEAGNSLDPAAWLWAQRQLPLLWVVDGFAGLTLLPVMGFAVQQNRLARKAEEMAQARDEHQNQLDRMIHNSEQTEQINAGQAEEIASLQQTVTELSTKLTLVETEATTRQTLLEVEARRLAEQAFAALSGQVEANTRQMEAVNLAMQYQRAEIKQLRQGLRSIQNPHELFDIAHLTPTEQAFLQEEAAPRMLEGDAEDEEKTRRREDETGENAGALLAAPNTIAPNTTLLAAPDPGLLAAPNRQSSIVNPTPNTQHPTPSPPGFFEPTMNAASTFVAPLTEYEVAAAQPEESLPPEEHARNEQNTVEREENTFAAPQEEATVLPFAQTDRSRHEIAAAPPSDTGVTEAEYRMLFDAAPPGSPDNFSHPASAPDPRPPAAARPRRWFLRF